MEIIWGKFQNIKMVILFRLTQNWFFYSQTFVRSNHLYIHTHTHTHIELKNLLKSHLFSNLRGFTVISSLFLYGGVCWGDFCVLFYEKINACLNNFLKLKLIYLLLYFWVPQTISLTLLSIYILYICFKNLRDETLLLHPEIHLNSIQL